MAIYSHYQKGMGSSYAKGQFTALPPSRMPSPLLSKPMPTGTVSDSSGISPSLYDVGIEISLSKSDGSYAAVLDQFDLTDRGGKAFYAHGDQSKIWYINYNGHRLSVRFFNAAPLWDPEDFRTVSDLFEFLVFTEDNTPTLPKKETVANPPDTDTP